jgi:hypothetical protein
MYGLNRLNHFLYLSSPTSTNLTILLFLVSRVESRVTRWVCKKIAQNFAIPIFCQN